MFPTRFLALSLTALLLSSLKLAAETDLHNPEAIKAWGESAHANSESPSFTRWNNSSRGTVPRGCARCHSTKGYHDYLGLDGSEKGEVNQAAPIGETVECSACHNELEGHVNESSMPSGVTLQVPATDAFCTDCHQGRESGASVTQIIADLSPDTMNSTLRLPLIHSNPVAATRHGRRALGGYQYPEQRYASFYDHSIQYNGCSTCHDQHTLGVKGSHCDSCHIGAATREGRRQIRHSGLDYDGDRNVSEGIAEEIETLRERLLDSIEVYALRTKEVEPISYRPESPYFFDQEGKRYNTWTPRLLAAAYNYRYTEEIGGYAHNPMYLIQLLYDSLSDLGTNMSGMTRP